SREERLGPNAEVRLSAIGEGLTLHEYKEFCAVATDALTQVFPGPVARGAMRGACNKKRGGFRRPVHETVRSRSGHARNLSRYALTFAGSQILILRVSGITTTAMMK